LPSERDTNKSNGGEGTLSIDAWMELFYASLLDHDPDKLTQRLEAVRLRGRNRKLHRAASDAERELLRAVLRAIDELAQQSRGGQSTGPRGNSNQAA
jgi:hypothetical protein